MAEYTFGTDDVFAADSTAYQATAGAAINTGQFFYLDESGNAQLAIADSTAHAAVVGMAVSSAAAAGQPFLYITSGEVTVDAAMFPFTGGVLVISEATAGICRDYCDLEASDYVSVVGYTTASNTFYLLIVNTGEQISSS